MKREPYNPSVMLRMTPPLAQGRPLGAVNIAEE